MLATIEQRAWIIRWLLDKRFGFDITDKLKHDYPEQWASVGIMRGIHNEALREEQRLKMLSDYELVSEYRDASEKQIERKQMLKEGLAASEVREQAETANAKIGKSVREGKLERDDFADKQDVIRIVHANKGKYPSIKAWIDSEDLKPFKRKYTGHHTLRDWVREAAPEISSKGGRPPKTI